MKGASGVVLGLALMLSVIIFVWPNSDREKQMEEMGFLGEHPLQEIEQDGDKWILVWAIKPDVFVRTTVPNNMVEFVTDEEKVEPTAEFIFSQEWLKAKRWDLYFASHVANLNLWLSEEQITEGKFLSVVVRISSSQLKELNPTESTPEGASSDWRFSLLFFSFIVYDDNS